MANKTVAQIQKQLDKTGAYAADRKLLQQQLAELPKQAQAEISGLQAQLQRANTQILDQARGRGLGFSGIPIAEQAQYAATEFAPALARVRQSQNEAKRGILSALNQLARDQYNTAWGIYSSERDFNESKRRWEAEQALRRQQAAQQAAAAQAASAASYLQAVQSQQKSSNKSSGPSKQDQAIYSRAKSLQNIYSMDRNLFNSLVTRLSQGNSADRSVVATVQKLLGGASGGGG